MVITIDHEINGMSQTRKINKYLIIFSYLILNKGNLMFLILFADTKITLKNEILKKEKCEIDQNRHNNLLKYTVNEIKNNGIVTVSINKSASAIEKIRKLSKFLNFLFIITLIIINKFSTMAIKMNSIMKNNVILS